MESSQSPRHSTFSHKFLILIFIFLKDSVISIPKVALENITILYINVVYKVLQVLSLNSCAFDLELEAGSR